MKDSTTPALALGLLLLCMGPVGCASFLKSRLNTDPRSGAMVFVGELKARGVLPGFALEERGEFSMDAGKMVLGVGAKYPLSVTIYASKKSKETIWYSYELSKMSTKGEWILVKAWQNKAGEWTRIPAESAGAETDSRRGRKLPKATN